MFIGSVEFTFSSPPPSEVGLLSGNLGLTAPGFDDLSGRLTPEARPEAFFRFFIIINIAGCTFIFA